MKYSKLLQCCAMLACMWTLPAWADDFDDWRDGVKQEAATQGISPRAITALDDLEFNPRVIELDGKQPEHKITFAEYQHNLLSNLRIKRGRENAVLHKAELDAATKAYGVPKKYLVALWGMESSYGSAQGKLNVLQSLATLAFNSRNSGDVRGFRGNLITALRIIDRDRIDPETMRGSWAGAMGQCQFMPKTYLKYGVDGDGDGRRDIWNSLPDVFASMANYMHAEGWQPGMAWGMRVLALHPMAKQIVGLTQAQPLTVWQKLGLRTANGGNLPADAVSMYYLVQPDGTAGPSFLVTPNYKVIMRWNRSTYFATTVGMLADMIEP